MAPRRRRTSSGEGAADAGSPGFQQLSDEVLVRILGCLNQKDRCGGVGKAWDANPVLPCLTRAMLPSAALSVLHGSPFHPVCRHRAALVSHRWHDCAHAPELCRQVRMDSLWRISRFGPWSHSVASLTAWLMRHGRHVRHMQLGGFHAKIESQEEQAQLACCLMACAGGQLETLRAAIDGLVVAAWAPAAVRSLRELQLGFAASELQISNSLHSLTQLTLLVLAGRPVRFAAGARLPASLRRLRLLDGSSSSLPAQVWPNAAPAPCIASMKTAPGHGITVHDWHSQQAIRLHNSCSEHSCAPFRPAAGGPVSAGGSVHPVWQSHWRWLLQPYVLVCTYPAGAA